MSIQQFTPDSRNTINWASGTSTEIFIYPPDGSFADRNFLFRISTATVEAEESTFTFFEGITRHLMILKGELELIHEGRYTKYLKPYEQDTFSGEWCTRSKGKVTDFNLMLKAGATGSLTHRRIGAGNGMPLAAKTAWYFLYFASGTATLSNGITANTGDLIRLENGTTVDVHALEHCDLIAIEVSLPQNLRQ
ncbi:HutD family protein [Adhaeribacter sp. BT258]|uniref:HutD family protein n=1 Tax=Adhaeribacter terrigena TaxID=2793070 RepID=A0ABS1C229_9BACT|nr:HutD family protein [Adhaeribacter terrigena]MBK0403373.1 HutD family protein [Adhaeribacter terrigena]